MLATVGLSRWRSWCSHLWREGGWEGSEEGVAARGREVKEERERWWKEGEKKNTAYFSK